MARYDMTGCSEQENDPICLYFIIFEDSKFDGHVSEVLNYNLGAYFCFDNPYTENPFLLR